jgi:tRNA(Ile)-lysidine synthase
METVMPAPSSPLPIATNLFRPGMRVAVAVSGGADSVALLRCLLEQRARLGVVLSVAHVHHGIRGAEADADAAFVEGLARKLDLPFFLERGNVPDAARASGETIEEAARNLRYGWFRHLLANGEADAVATAHTLDDQAETVLHRLLRGAWTEGLGGIHPVLGQDRPSASTARRPQATRGVILRPFLAIRRTQIESWLVEIGQPWREDSSNLDQAHTRNRLRHSLLPQLAEFNPQIANQFAHLAELARDEEDYWQSELARLLPTLLLPGRAVRGGGRATQHGESSVSIELERLSRLHPALRRRVLRAAAAQLGVSLDFAQTEELMALCQPEPEAPRPAKAAVGGQLCVQRTGREIRLTRRSLAHSEVLAPVLEYTLPIPGEVEATAFGLRLRATLRDSASGHPAPGPDLLPNSAKVRGASRTDRVQLRHSRGLQKAKQVFERLNVPASHRPHWPVVEWELEIVWMQGVGVESAKAVAAGLIIQAEML